MPGTFLTVQNYVALALGVVLFGVQLFALIDSLRHPAQAYAAVGKLSKPAWVAITAVCAAIGLLVITAPLSIFEILAIVGAGIYLADMRPKLMQVTGKRRGDGPYGPW